MNTKFLFIMLVIVAGGIFIVSTAMHPTVSSDCYQALNAAGQVIETICH